jgi:SAM-dependent methyltransferase
MKASLIPRDGSHITGDPERIVPDTPNWERGYSDHIQRYEFVARNTPCGARVLDAGCGSGYGAAHLIDCGAGSVVAVDIATEALEVARQHFHRRQIVWLQDDCHTLEAVAPYAPFDVVCNLENLEHLRKPESLLARATQLLKPDGVLITTTPNRLLLNKLRGEKPDAPPRNPYHYKEYTASEFNTLLTAYFSDVAIWYQCHTVSSRNRLSLEQALYMIWSNPAVRLGRWLQRVMRRRQIPQTLDQILPPYHPEWEIVENDPGADVTWTFIGACRQPKNIFKCTS